MTKRAILYARVSTDEQAEKGYSLQTQLAACRKYAGAYEFIVVAEYQDDSTGAQLDRPGLDQLRAQLAKREADVVVVFTSDRLSRSLAHSLILREEWQRAGIELHYVSRGKLENTAEGRLTENIEAVIAEYEREKIRERTRRGRLAKAEAGKWVGVGSTSFGFRKVGLRAESRLEIDEAEIAIVRRIFRLVLEGMKLNQITSLFNAEGVPTPGHRQSKKAAREWYTATIKVILNNRAYIGEFSTCGTILRIPDLAIIDRETWEAAQQRLKRNRELSKRNRVHDYLLSGYLKCACGGKMFGLTVYPKGKKHSYYGCYKVTHCFVNSCGEPYLRVDKTDALVWNWLKETLGNMEKLDVGLKKLEEQREQELQPSRDRLAMIADLMDQAERKINRLAAEFANTTEPVITEALRAQMKAAARERESLLTEQAILRAKVEQRELSASKIEAVKKHARAVQSRLDGNPSCDRKRELLEFWSVSVSVRWEEGRRWLDMSCIVKDWDLSLVYDDSRS